MTAIVTDAHYRMSVALIRDLGEHGVDVIACETAAHPHPVGFASRYAARCVTLAEDGYLDGLYGLCERTMKETGARPALLPVGAATLALLAENRGRFDPVCGLCIPTSAQLSLFNDKQAVQRLAARLGVPAPQSYEPTPGEPEDAFFSRIPLPCVVKPACGEKFGLSAAARYRVAASRSALQQAYEHFSACTGERPIVQQYLPGGGLGCSVLCQNGAVVCAIAHRRLREYPVSGGPSSCCQVIDSAPLLPFVRQLVAEVGYTGLAMFEFKEDAAGTAHLLEINPRIWGTYPLTRASKSNFSLCWLALSLGQQAPAYREPLPVKMVYYPSDFAAALGYLRRGEAGRFFSALADFFRPGARNGLRERTDPRPAHVYYRQLFQKRRHS